MVEKSKLDFGNTTRVTWRAQRRQWRDYMTLE